MDVSSTAPTDTSLARDAESIVEPAPSSEQDLKLKRVPAVVSWQDPTGEHRCRDDLRLTITCTGDGTRRATLNLSATGRIRKSPAKPDLLLLIKPEHIQALRCVESDSNSEDEERLCQQARAKLRTSIYTLRFEMRRRLTFVVPLDCSFASFRTTSQRVWESMKTFAQETTCFDVHFPASVAPKQNLISFCYAASGSRLTWQASIIRLYGGKGGKVVDLDETNSDEADVGGVAPPSYDTYHDVNSLAAPPLCLSPRDSPRPCKRRRINSSDSDVEADAADKAKEGGRPSSSRAMLAEILTRVKRIEDRLDSLEEQQENIATGVVEELETHVKPLLEPFRDEMDARLLSQEVQDEESMRDMATEVVGEVVSENLEEVVSDFFAGEGQDLIETAVREVVDKVLAQRIQDGIRESLRVQRFTGSFTVDTEQERQF